MRKVRNISDAGERVVYLYPNDCYFAHLSIYHFASDFCLDKVILDAGCGTGYGAHNLIEHGAASVLAIDSSSKAISFCRKHFENPNLTFQQMDISRIEGLQEQQYDVIFSSNALEHVSGIARFFYSANRLLKPNGVLVIAVPPITNEAAREDNLSNMYHLNIWSLRQWQFVINQYFQSTVSHRHICSRSDIRLDFSNGPDQCEITERDFDFPRATLDEMEKKGTISAVFVAHRPRPLGEIPSQEDSIEYIDDSFSRPAPPKTLFQKIVDRARELAM